MQLQSGSCHGIAGGGWCPGVRLIYGIFGGATVHGDVSYSTQICSHKIKGFWPLARTLTSNLIKQLQPLLFLKILVYSVSNITA